MNFVEKYPVVIQPTSLLRKNRSCSYIAFIIKEIYDFFTLKSLDDYPVYKLRNEYREIQELNNLLDQFDKEKKDFIKKSNEDNKN